MKPEDHGIIAFDKTHRLNRLATLSDLCDLIDQATPQELRRWATLLRVIDRWAEAMSRNSWSPIDHALRAAQLEMVKLSPEDLERMAGFPMPKCGRCHEPLTGAPDDHECRA